jgi:hypothetical protein
MFTRAGDQNPTMRSLNAVYDSEMKGGNEDRENEEEQDSIANEEWFSENAI